MPISLTNSFPSIKARKSSDLPLPFLQVQMGQDILPAALSAGCLFEHGKKELPSIDSSSFGAVFCLGDTTSVSDDFIGTGTESTCGPDGFAHIHSFKFQSH